MKITRETFRNFIFLKSIHPMPTRSVELLRQVDLGATSQWLVLHQPGRYSFRTHHYPTEDSKNRWNDLSTIRKRESNDYKINEAIHTVTHLLFLGPLGSPAWPWSACCLTRDGKNCNDIAAPRFHFRETNDHNRIEQNGAVIGLGFWQRRNRNTATFIEFTHHYKVGEDFGWQRYCFTWNGLKWSIGMEKHS